MMNTDPVSVSDVRWRKIFPLLQLKDALALTFRIRTLVPALLMVISLIPLNAFHGGPDRIRLFGRGVLRAENEVLPFATRIPTLMRSLQLFDIQEHLNLIPFIVQLLIAAVCSLAIAHATGGAVSRDQRIGPIKSLKFSLRKLVSLLLAMLILVVIGALLLWASTLVEVILGLVFQRSWMMHVKALTGIWCGVICFSAIAVSALATAAIAIDDCGAADAVSRSINYCWSHFLLTLSAFFVLSLSPILVDLIIWQLEAFGNQIRFREGGVSYRNSLWPQVFAANLTTIGVTILYLLLRQKEDATKITEMKALSA